MSGPFGSSQWMYNAGGGFYDFPISNSLRFNDDDSPTLRITPGTAGNRKTWTSSFWVKRANLGSGQRLGINAGTSNTKFTGFNFNSNDTINFFHRNNTSDSYAVQTTRVFRDTSSWYHFVLACDTTQSTAADRVKMYVNGEQVLFPTTVAGTSGFPSQNQDMEVNNTAYHHTIGANWNGVDKFDGYHADYTHIDGLQLTPSSFAETKNDIWIPKDTSGLTFGTNGFRLQFKQTGTGTASSTTIGADTSGNDNHWTSNSLVASDVVPDSPTNNFATLNPVEANDGAAVTLSEGNLQAFNSSGTSGRSFATISASSGKIYAEFLVKTVGTTTTYIGPATPFVNATLRAYRATGEYFSGSSWGSYGASYTSGDIISVEVDIDNDTLEFSKNGASQGIKTSVGLVVPVRFQVNSASSSYHVANFGQDSSFAGNETAQGNADANGIGDFYYAPPSGFLALCTANLPDPVAAVDPAKGGSPQDYFNTIIWSGTGSSNALDVGFQPDFTWIKRRNGTQSHNLHNSVNGATKYLISNTNAAEQTDSSILASFDTNGITVGDNTWSNASGGTYAAWNWKVGGSSSVNTDGTDIDSTGVFNTDLGMSIVTYTGTGSSGDSYGHGLDKAPELVLVKDRTDPANWAVFFTLTGVDGYLRLNDTNIKTTDTNIFPSVSATTIGVGTQGDGSIANTSGDSYVSYNFHSVDGYSKIGSYTGNSNADGSFIYTGFRPAWLLIKKTSATDNWAIHDNKRADYGVNSNPIDDYLKPDSNGSEFDDGASVDFLSNGFKWRINSGMRNQSGQTYSYMAFAEQPFKYANAR